MPRQPTVRSTVADFLRSIAEGRPDDAQRLGKKLETMTHPEHRWQETLRWCRHHAELHPDIVRYLELAEGKRDADERARSMNEVTTGRRRGLPW